MLPSFASQTIARIRPGTKTERGSEIPDWENADRLYISGCSVQPASTNLSQDGRVLGIADSWTAYIPQGADVKAGDRIEFDGETFEIYGDPREWTAALNLSHIQLDLRRWEG